MDRLTDAELAELRMEHAGDGGCCYTCMQWTGSGEWPCITARLLNELDYLKANAVGGADETGGEQ